jgi:hypothetical protein
VTPQELKVLIESDPQAKALAEAGNDYACAIRCSEISPLIRSSLILTERGLYNKLGPMVAETILQKFEHYAGSYKALVSRVLKWLRPSEGGSDFGDPSMIQFLSLLLAEGLSITQSEFDAISNLSLSHEVIGPGQVSEAWASYRPGGKIK